jgi:nucleotide-binding universal stress UspA family protein
MTHVMACIDGSTSSSAVCDCAAWASLRLQAPLTFLHVLDQNRYPKASDFSGNIGLGSREHLLEALAELDAKRSKLALEQGNIMLEAAKARAHTDGIATPNIRQRHGDLAATLAELENDIRLLVIGKQGEASGSLGQHIGSQLENVIRTLHRPILVTATQFKVPESLMLAFDGGATTRSGVDTLAASPLFRNLPIHLVMVGVDSAAHREQLQQASRVLGTAGFTVQTAIRTGEVEPALHTYQAEHRIDLLAMGAYGHSRIRKFLVGSTTTNMIRTTSTAMLLLR